MVKRTVSFPLTSPVSSCVKSRRMRRWCQLIPSFTLERVIISTKRIISRMRWSANMTGIQNIYCSEELLYVVCLESCMYHDVLYVVEVVTLQFIPSRLRFFTVF